jgi:hypothetical protein
VVLDLNWHDTHTVVVQCNTLASDKIEFILMREMLFVWIRLTLNWVAFAAVAE